VERLTGDATHYDEHVSFRLADAVELPGDPEDEVDIEVWPAPGLTYPARRHAATAARGL
jgi:Protein of unknown function (DUF3616)